MNPKMTSESKKVQNFSSNLLTPEENRKFFYSLGKHCIILAATVVQLYLTEEGSHSAWYKKCSGVVCFVKDCERHAYFIKLFDMDKAAWVWELQLYNAFVYKPTCTFFHVFEADNCMFGLYFADNDEALNFKSAVQKELQMRDERKRGAKSQSSQSLANGRAAKKEKTKKLTKDDLSTPTNFMHVQHVGWDPNKGFDIENVDEDLKLFFALAGVSDKDLNDYETRNFIYDFLENHGGIEKAKQEISQKYAKPQSSLSLAHGRDAEENKKKKLTKDDIRTPTNFMHVQHVGWDPNKGFDIKNVDEDLKLFFTLAGVSDKDLNDCETRNFLYDFLENHGGIEKAKQEISQKYAKPQSSLSLANGRDAKENKKKKLTKDDIRTPTNFMHVQHVGWDPNKGFDIENVDEDLKLFFTLAGVTDKDLNDYETRNFIFDFLENHGGVEKAKREIAEKYAKLQSSQSLANDRDAKKDKKKKLTKDDIRTPTNFLHVQHIGLDPNKGFDIENADGDLKLFFTLAGVSDKDLNDYETRNFIYHFLESHGGIEKTKQKIAQK